MELESCLDILTEKKLVTQVPTEALEVERLPGDASNREYARLKEVATSKSFILMIMNEKEAFKSEEAGATGQSSDELDFVAIGRDWIRAGIKVPQIYYVDEKSRFLLLEDFGNELLYGRRQKESAIHLYEAAMRELIKIQKLQPFDRITKRKFSKELLIWEFEHFREYALEKRGVVLNEGQSNVLKNFFESSVNCILKIPETVTHRDYHSKNIMVLTDDKIGIIDFQDALMGPYTYDLASLLRDSYVRLTDQEEQKLIQIYESESGRKVDLEAFAISSLQRNMKAVGRFFYISMVKHKATHLPYVLPTMKRILKSLEDIGEGELKRILENVSWE
ncbi:MAG: hypothetical protein COV44_06505 [Deltaproteobacteria bacterium CG11_big_fil_rev_8_21_14_0_20_45_16]|nr:MAG: hypothetical protein COV44_06505 [Deltaproteobacteria bacterium CG11_big_fil_rev_8_21_14_0_20_45_16]